jgi:hypothetical protein
MFFQRMAAKTDLINTVVAQTHGLPDSLNGSVSDMLVGICEVRPQFFHIYLEPTMSPDEGSLVQPLNALQTICFNSTSMRRRFIP